KTPTGWPRSPAARPSPGAAGRARGGPPLCFFPGGAPPPTPAELVGSTRMQEVLDLAREEFDFVILDSPPVTPVSDALVLARASDGVVLVVKGQDTPRDLVRRARDQLALTGAHLLGAVVNNVGSAWGDFRFYQRYAGYYDRPQLEEEPAWPGVRTGCCGRSRRRSSRCRSSWAAARRSGSSQRGSWWRRCSH